ncbi:hypothetical protein TREES_T100016827 [Tupaia chinensis]|uniref:Uncharacterized protein n=1 Tax=Tupaia chinensis TaxID=246437 RepID=L9L3I3_TUPCH|nr:hypothetical protein TREES_T100016827 [Tupaia chinensis]
MRGRPRIRARGRLGDNRSSSYGTRYSSAQGRALRGGHVMADPAACHVTCSVDWSAVPKLPVLRFSGMGNPFLLPPPASAPFIKGEKSRRKERLCSALSSSLHGRAQT